MTSTSPQVFLFFYVVNDTKLSTDLNKRICSLYVLKAAWTLEYTLSFPHALCCIFCGIMISISQGCCLTGARSPAAPKLQAQATKLVCFGRPSFKTQNPVTTFSFGIPQLDLNIERNYLVKFGSAKISQWRILQNTTKSTML